MSFEQSTQQQQIRQSYCVSGHFVKERHDVVGQNQEGNPLIVDKTQNKAQLAAYLHDPVKDVFIATKQILQLNQNYKTTSEKEITQDTDTTSMAKLNVQSLRKKIAAKLPKIKDIIEEMNDHQIEKVYREHIGGKGSSRKFKGFQSKPIILLSLQINTKQKEAKQRSLQIQDQKEQMTGPFKIKRTESGIIKAFIPQQKKPQRLPEQS